MTVSKLGSVISEGSLKFSSSYGYMGNEYMSMTSGKEAFFGLDAARQTVEEDLDELREEEVWGEETVWEERKREPSFVQRAVKEGTDSNGAGENFRRSRLSVEMQSATFGRTRASTLFSKPSINQNRFADGSTGAVRTKIPQASKGSDGYGYGYGKQAEVGEMSRSAPVSVAYWSKTSALKESDAENGDEDYGEEDEDDEMRLPPHEFLARQYAKSKAMAFSVFEGAGRTLKGMDLRRVRNSVWRQTGFID